MADSRRKKFERKLIATAVAACFAGQFAYANPVGPTVVNGQVSFATQGNVLSVTNSPGSIINWQQFSIAGGETTRFIQQSAASSVLNRVVGIDPSSILGTLQSNGRVFLINPNGIIFGAGSRIDVAGLVASTLNLSNPDFLAGRMNFTGDPALAAAVVNQGRITANPGGSVYLVGSAVDNQGVITAPNGDVVLAAGNSVRVTSDSTARLQVEITAPADHALNLSQVAYGSQGIYAGLVRNGGTISANSVSQTADGRIVLKASGDVQLAAGSSTTASGASAGTVSIESGGATTVAGAVQANGDGSSGGTVSLKAATDLTLDSGSSVSASGASGGTVTVQSGATTLVSGGIQATGNAGAGGTVQVLGDHVGLLDNSSIDASGQTGGGYVIVGGDFHGANPNVQNATATYVSPTATINADAIQSGNGGNVAVWSNGITRFYGTVSAKGGAQSGNGGFVETSGRGNLDFQGQVDTTASVGTAGTLLLDPSDITICLASVICVGGNMSAGPIFTATAEPGTLTTAVLQAALAGNNVIVDTNTAV